MNLSLAQINSCIAFSHSGIYTLDKLSIHKNEFNDIKIDISETPTLIKKNNDDPNFNAYVLKGTIKYFENNESKEIVINYCTDFKYLVNLSKVEIEVNLYPVIEKKDGTSNISITSSNITNFESKALALDDAKSIDIGEINGDSTLTGYMKPNEQKETYVGYSTNLSSKQDSRGQKRKRTNESQGESSAKKISRTDCSILQPGSYKLDEKEYFHIQIISSKQYNSTNRFIVIGFLRYAFFAVPIFGCEPHGKNLIFSLSRNLTKDIVLNSTFNQSQPINYEVPRNKFIDQNYTEKNIFPRLIYESSHYNIGCSLLYKGLLYKKSTFNLKDGVKININNFKSIQGEISLIHNYTMNGTIIIDGGEYFFDSCVLKYDGDFINDSEIVYYSDKTNKDEIRRSYRFNLLDFLPSLKS